MLAVHGTEGVVHERAVGAGERDELVRERAALGVVLGRLAGIEPHVFKDQYFAVLQRSGQRLRRLADGVFREGNLERGKLRQARDGGLERVLFFGGALGASQVCCDQHAGTGVRQLLQHWQGGLDAAIVSHCRAVERHVQVTSDQNVPPADTISDQFVEGVECHESYPSPAWLRRAP